MSALLSYIDMLHRRRWIGNPRLYQRLVMAFVVDRAVPILRPNIMDHHHWSAPRLGFNCGDREEVGVITWPHGLGSKWLCLRMQWPWSITMRSRQTQNLSPNSTGPLALVPAISAFCQR